MAFRCRPVFIVVAGLHIFLLVMFLVRYKSCHEVSKVGGSLGCVIPLCRFLNLPITRLYV